MELPKLGHNRTLLTALVAGSIPLAVGGWLVSTFFETDIAVTDVAALVAALSGPLGFLLGRKDE